MSKYYVDWKPGTMRPEALYRFYDGDPYRNPEFYKKGKGWVAESDLYLRRMSGEIDDDNIISEHEALAIIRAWEAASRSEQNMPSV